MFSWHAQGTTLILFTLSKICETSQFLKVQEKLPEERGFTIKVIM